MSAYKDPRDGQTWRYRCWVTTRDGRKVRISGRPNVNTRQAAEVAERAHIQRAETEAPAIEAPREVPTFKEYAERFMLTYAAVHNKPSEQTAKQSILDTHLLPAWGDLALDAVDSTAVKALSAKLIKAGKSAKRVNNVLNVVSKILKEAVEDGVLATMPRVRTLKIAQADFDFFTFEELEGLVRRPSRSPRGTPRSGGG